MLLCPILTGSVLPQVLLFCCLFFLFFPLVCVQSVNLACVSRGVSFVTGLFLLSLPEMFFFSFSMVGVFVLLYFFLVSAGSVSFASCFFPGTSCFVLCFFP